MAPISSATVEHVAAVKANYFGTLNSKGCLSNRPTPHSIKCRESLEELLTFSLEQTEVSPLSAPYRISILVLALARVCRIRPRTDSDLSRHFRPFQSQFVHEAFLPSRFRKL